ncbi:hypothetical protein [Pseudomonas sp. KNUC1026]|uniref:hypothetical protein n=1 Tax=Pseudomonas sp. KNUC1026 TaxID=2893890 RepID=UPI001F206B3F|nr:hypothetical protein [Pseudomonas sp. KNUC1026]UFH50619.1 hypothetical protein LN139_05400 [Pseudomonas sp. KNUC1026]
MKIRKNMMMAALAAATMCAAGAAFAGPPVEVTFKNLGTQKATYQVITQNEALTYAHATGRPKTELGAGETDKYYVQIPINPDANAANVRYTMGNKTCVFMTTFVNQVAPGGCFLAAQRRFQNGIKMRLPAVAQSVTPLSNRKIFQIFHGP